MTAIPDGIAAALSGRYTVEREAGAGGMATVYLAHDVKHDRKVALKVLRPDVAAVLGAERFLHEIKVTANLQHPNILPVYDSGEVPRGDRAGPLLYFVMPYVDGESLRDRLTREKQLPVEDAVEITRAVAGALSFAHERGVVHRDVKPENILLQGGQPLVADFGIALAVSQASDTRLTETGLSIGTPHYMSPEQASGDRHLDARTDVYSLGAMLYEMLTGDPPHTGSTAQAIVSKILTETPAPVSQSRAFVPPNVDAALAKALAKVPADRFSTADGFVQALSDPGFRVTIPSRLGGPSRLRRLWPVTTALLALALAWTLWNPAPLLETGVVFRAPLDLPDGQEIAIGLHGVSIAADGSFFVYPGTAEAGERLWLRRLDDITAVSLPGTEAGQNPRISPDGQRVAFSVWNGLDWTLKVAAIGDGSARSLTDSIRAGVADWGPDDRLYFQGPGNGLWRIPAAGGPIERLTTPDTAEGERWHARPEVLPGGRGILFNVLGNGRQVLAVLDLGTGRVVRTEIDGGFPVYAASGHVVYRASGRGDEALYAIPFDRRRLRFSGDPRSIPLRPRRGLRGEIELAVADDGTVVYVSTERQRTDAVWVDRAGRIVPVDPTWTDVIDYPRIAPDGTRLVAPVDGAGGRRDLWAKALDRGPPQRVTFDGRRNDRPSWHPDSRSVAFLRDGAGGRQLLTARLDGSDPVRLARGFDGFIEAAVWMPDGERLVVQVGGFGVESRMHLLRAHPDSVPRPIGNRPGSEYGPAVSPDGRFVAFVSSRTGRDEVAVTTIPGAEAYWQVSQAGGSAPSWAPDGRELYYRSASGSLVAVTTTLEPTFAAGDQRDLFPTSAYRSSAFHRQYDVHPDGRFLMVRQQGHAVVVVRNWFAVVEALFDGG